MTSSIRIPEEQLILPRFFLSWGIYPPIPPTKKKIRMDNIALHPPPPIKRGGND